MRSGSATPRLEVKGKNEERVVEGAGAAAEVVARAARNKKARRGGGGANGMCWLKQRLQPCSCKRLVLSGGRDRQARRIWGRVRHRGRGGARAASRVEQRCQTPESGATQPEKAFKSFF